jgi:hypothetical protein
VQSQHHPASFQPLLQAFERAPSRGSQGPAPGPYLPLSLSCQQTAPGPTAGSFAAPVQGQQLPPFMTLHERERHEQRKSASPISAGTSVMNRHRSVSASSLGPAGSGPQQQIPRFVDIHGHGIREPSGKP